MVKKVENIQLNIISVNSNLASNNAISDKSAKN